MQRLEVSGAVRPIYGSLGVKQLRNLSKTELVRYKTVEHCSKREQQTETKFQPRNDSGGLKSGSRIALTATDSWHATRSTAPCAK